MVRKISVIGKQQQTFRIHIQPSHGIDPAAAVRNQRGHIFAPLFVGQRGDETSGLIEHDVHIFHCGRKFLSVHFDGIYFGISSITQPRSHTVYGDPPLLNPFFRLPPGG